ncbi:GDYXXLXY domain-containing protein [Aquibacillus albus]|uniref:Membrane-anchored protein n=1 Tax=Aquibacillus albus TaxID=1168171 RepID=A0ABS2N085_9BACI|nr:GDYXXLXY domain-containing protein [Aquibacillus albus]MBM7571501.1 putative membrane-anchored protein [Aquibacillus albus]
MRRKRVLFFVVVVLQCLFLLGMVCSYYLIDDFGKTIQLKTVPVDPQDIFYGDYIILRYEIEEIDRAKWTGTEEPSYHERIFTLVADDNGDGIYQVIQASSEEMIADAGQVVLEGRYEYQDMHEGTYFVDYGLGRYYIEDNTGERYERSGELIVSVAVAPWGQKKIVTVEPE